jgi:hypothetical protein
MKTSSPGGLSMMGYDQRGPHSQPGTPTRHRSIIIVVVINAIAAVMVASGTAVIASAAVVVVGSAIVLGSETPGIAS